MGMGALFLHFFAPPAARSGSAGNKRYILLPGNGRRCDDEQSKRRGAGTGGALSGSLPAAGPVHADANGRGERHPGESCAEEN